MQHACASRVVCVCLSCRLRVLLVSFACASRVLLVCFACASRVTVFNTYLTRVCPLTHAFDLGATRVSHAFLSHLLCTKPLHTRLRSLSHAFLALHTRLHGASHACASRVVCVCFSCRLRVPLVSFACASRVVCVSHAYASRVTRVCIIPCRWPVL